jgi:hypothetical protein
VKRERDDLTIKLPNYVKREGDPHWCRDRIPLSCRIVSGRHAGVRSGKNGDADATATAANDLASQRHKKPSTAHSKMLYQERKRA